MKRYFKLMLGRKSSYAEACFKGGIVGTDFNIHHDLSERLPDEWREFNKEFIPIYLEQWPEKTKIAAGLACGAIWTVSKGMKDGDIVLSHDGLGRYHVGEISGPYSYAQGEFLPHRRPVRWLDQNIQRDDMSQALKNAAGAIGTVSDITKYAEEIERLLRPDVTPPNETAVEDPYSFVMEKHLEDFLVRNWGQTELGKNYEIYEEDGEMVGQQYLTDTGPLDILAVSKDRKALFVIELKKGRASDAVVGQLLRYMGFVQEDIAESGQIVRGLVVALDDDQRLRRALSMVSNVEFYRYQVSFKLVKA